MQSTRIVLVTHAVTQFKLRLKHMFIIFHIISEPSTYEIILKLDRAHEDDVCDEVEGPEDLLSARSVGGGAVLEVKKNQD